MKRIALFPGSFDPFTKGHEDIVLRGTQLFDEIIIAIGYNSGKTQRYFPIDFMVGKIRDTFSDNPAVKVETYAELTAEYAKKNGAKYLLRGLRNTTDFEYENSIATEKSATAVRQLANGIPMLIASVTKVECN